jgi:signal transduction histidine kinase
MEITLDWAMRQSNTTAGLIGVVEENNLKVMASEGYNQVGLFGEDDDFLAVEIPIVEEAISSGQAQRMKQDSLNGATLLPDARSQIVIPIRREADVIGLLLLESTDAERYSDETQAFLNRLSDHAAIAISNAQLYAAVQQANIAKSDFVSFVSHELKTPMTSIKGYAELLAAGAVGDINDAQSNFLSTIRTNVNRMSTLVSDLADVSRIEAGRIHLEFGSVSIAEIVDEVVSSTQAMIEEKEHELSLDIPDDLPLVWGDRNRLVQVLTNLVSNANKYTPDGGKIIIRASRSENEWDPEGVPFVVHISVEDNGIGIKSADQKNIFRQYFRTDEGKETATGTGLGLNISRYLVEIQGGQIWFESIYQQGTTFHFTVPVTELGAN